jgi:hypothetical protein
VTDTTGKGRSVRKESRQSNAWEGRRGRRFIIFCIMAASAIVAYILGMVWARWDIADDKRLIQDLQSENQRLKKEVTDQNAGLVALQAQLKSVQAALEEIMPSENTYRINPNQSLIVAGGRLTVGLVGSPTNEQVSININGKQQLAATGDVISIPLDPPANCRVRVQSFDMFKATITASCTGL